MYKFTVRAKVVTDVSHHHLAVVSDPHISTPAMLLISNKQSEKSLSVGLKGKCMTLKIFISLSFVALMVIICNWRCVFGSHSPSFIICRH